MKKVFAFAATFIISASLFSQEKLSAVTASWTTVIPGRVICEPSPTSYGFSLITDAQEISAFTNNGKTLWEKPLQRSRNAFVSTLKDDFFAVVTDNATKLILLNPSGCEIWSTQTDFNILDKPFSGRDGRFFIRGSNVLQCFGINGICRWTLETPLQSPLPVLELNDGSLVVFLAEKKDNKTIGLRISPFGELLEEITFSGEILRAFSCNEGILLNFSDGTAGLFTVSDGKAVNKWVLLISVNSTEQIHNATFVVSSGKDLVVFLLPSQNSVEVHQINQHNGEITHSFTVTDINGLKLTGKQLSSDGIFLCDETKARFYSLSANDLWNAILPSKNESYNFFFLTKDNHLVFCGENWSLNSYLITQNTVIKSQKNQEKRTYSDFIKPNSNIYAILYTDTIDREFVSTERTQNLLTGNYGAKEILWLNEMLGYCNEFESYLKSDDFGIHLEKSPFETDSTGVNKMLSQLPLYSTFQTTEYTARFLNNLTNKSYISTLLSAISNNGYDPDGKILEAIQFLSSKYTNNDERLIISTCDAVYSICLFMGRPAFNSKGKNILAQFLRPNYSLKAKTYARNTLKKISDLSL